MLASTLLIMDWHNVGHKTMIEKDPKKQKLIWMENVFSLLSPSKNVLEFSQATKKIPKINFILLILHKMNFIFILNSIHS